MPKSQSVFFLEWSISRGIGKSAKGGETKKVLIGPDGTGSFNHVFDVEITLHQKSGKFESRAMKINIKEEAQKKKAKTTLKHVVELADLASLTGDFESKVYSLSGTKQKPAPTLKLRVKTEWLKYDGKAITNAAGTRSDGTQREAIEVGGQQVFLMTDQEISDEEKSGEEDPFKDDAEGTNNGGGALFKKSEGSKPPQDPVGGFGGALFRKLDGEVQTPSQVPSNLRILEDAKNINNPFATTSTPAEPLSARSAAAAAASSSSSSSTPAPLSARSAAVAATAPPAVVVTPASSNVVTPPSSPGKPVMSPNSEELELLRRQNKLLQETLDKQEEKIDQLRQKMRAGRKGGSPVGTPSMGGDAFIREKERELEDLSAKLADTEKANKSLTIQVDSLTKALENEKQRALALEGLLAQQQNKVKELSSAKSSGNNDAALVEERKRSEEAVSRAKKAEEKAALDRQRLESEVAAAKKQTDELSAKLKAVDASEKRNAAALDAEKKRVLALEASLALEKKRADSASKSEVERKKTEEVEKKSAGNSKQDSSKDVETLKAKLVDSEKETEKLKLQLATVNRELSGNQLQMIDLTNRLREAEAKHRDIDSKSGSQDGEVTSLQMQIAAMEQDFESQLEELRAELEEAKQANKSSRSRSGSVVEKPDLEKDRMIEDLKKQVSQMDSQKQELAEKDRALQKLKKQLVEMEQQKQEAQVLSSPAHGLGRNPLMAAPPASPFASDEFDKLATNLNIMMAVQDGVWGAQLEYDDSGVAMASGLILGIVREDAGSKTSGQLHESLVTAIEMAAENQLCLEGRFYWLNAVLNMLHTIASSSLALGMRSPKDTGVVFGAAEVSQAPGNALKSARDALGAFAGKLGPVAEAIYKLIVADVRKNINGVVVTAILEPPINARDALGARHNTGAAPTADGIVLELDAALRAAVGAHIFTSVVKQFFGQLFYDMGAVLFNAMMKRQDLSASRGVQIKLEVSNFDNWPMLNSVNSAIKEALRGVSRGLNPLKEVCNLMLVDKAMFVGQKAALYEMCPSLNARQVKSFLSAFVPDDICPTKTPLEVLDSLTSDVRKSDALKMDESLWLTLSELK